MGLPSTGAVLRRRWVALAATALAASALAGCGGGEDESSSPASPAPLRSQAPLASQSAPTPPGQVVRPGPHTPKPVADAIRSGQVVVVSFLMPGTADDDSVRHALRQVGSAGPSSRNVRYFTYTLQESRRFGDLPELLNVTLTPSVAVIARDGRLSNLWSGLVDADLLRQSISDAKVAVPREGAG